MENKEKYFRALIENQGRLNESDLGQAIGLNDNETFEIIAQLLSEYRIEHINNNVCCYRPSKKKYNLKHHRG
ncbi:MAG: hypothetical protein LBI72_08790 [Flavobacteriaceae bacterium]|jgi:hypothetical protein|nr:hypothetical protein [Flavobacteriaceae bacterium]